MVSVNSLRLSFLSPQEKKKKENRLVNRLGLTKMVEDMKELFTTVTGFRGQLNPAENRQNELLMKMCAALDSLPARINGKEPETPAPEEKKYVPSQESNQHNRECFSIPGTRRMFNFSLINDQFYHYTFYMTSVIVYSTQY